MPLAAEGTALEARVAEADSGRRREALAEEGRGLLPTGFAVGGTAVLRLPDLEGGRRLDAVAGTVDL